MSDAAIDRGARRAARAVDAMRRGWPIRVTGADGANDLIAVESARDAALVRRAVYRGGGRTWLRAGAGIVGASTPERELEETREKLRSVSRFLVGEESP